MSAKLNKQQQRRIRANRLDKLRDYEADAVGVVVSHLGFEVMVSYQGQLLTADWRKQIGTIACNDKVLISKKNNRAVIEAVLPRSHTLSKWSGRELKPLVSHVDQLLIVIAVKPQWQSGLLDRYLIAAREAGITVGILCNKIDLLEQSAQQTLSQRLQPYAELGCPIFYASVQAQTGLEPVVQWLSAKQTVICGQSGVGKSSLIAHLIPDVEIWIQAISEATELGRHTTTNLRRYPYLPDGAVIDTPGVRGFDIAHLSKEAVMAGFSDIAAYTSACRFNDCSHRHEPDCAVLSALKEEKIHPQRYQSLMQILDEIQ